MAASLKNELRRTEPNMNLDKLKQDVGYRVKLVPSACHLDIGGDLLPAPDEDWTIMAVTDDYVEITAATSHVYRLGKDHIHHFTTDMHRSADGLQHGFLTLNVQLFIQGADVRAVPNHPPGAPVAPPPVNRSERARAHFAPELERLFRRQVWVLGRIVPNYTMTSLEKDPCGDTWESLRPYQPVLFPSSPLFQDLSSTDAKLLAEFCNSLQEVNDIVIGWTDTQSLREYNCWNVLMHKVQHSLRAGEQAIQRFCPDRQYDATVPSAGTLLSQSQRTLSIADRARDAFMARFAATAQARASIRRATLTGRNS